MFNFEKHIPPKWVYWKYKTYGINMEPLEPNTLKKQMGHKIP
jgi:hypothetical protein